MNAAWLAAVGTLAAMVAIPVLAVAVVREWAAMERRRVKRVAAWERGRLAMEREYHTRRNGRQGERQGERPEREAADELPMAEGGQ
jgi:uncharacterized membrane protein YcjF (UPF0283 family)